jgi:hypothetical protein
MIDEVAYFRQGHQEFHAEAVIAYTQLFSVVDQDLPYLLQPNMPPVLICQVVAVQYVVGPPTICVATLRPLDANLGVHEFMIRFCDLGLRVLYFMCSNSFKI